MFGTSTPSTNIPEPMPVPNVSTSTTPGDVPSGAEADLGQPGGVGVVDDVDVGADGLGEQGVGVDVRSTALSTLAALWITPWRTTPGNVTPIGPCHEKCSTSSATTGAIASGVAGFGVRILNRSAASSPVASVDRRRLHARAADVDPERLLDRHVGAA